MSNLALMGKHQILITIMNKLPYLPIYQGDFLRGNVSATSLASQGLWLRLKMLMQDSERTGYLCINGLPMNPKFVATKVGISLDEYETHLAELMSVGAFQSSKDGILFCPEILEQQKQRQATSDRVKKHRNLKRTSNGSVTDVKQPSNADVTQSSIVSSVSSSLSMSERDKTGTIAVNQDAEQAVTDLLEKVRLEYGTADLPKKEKWFPIARSCIDFNIETQYITFALRQLLDDPTRRFDVTPQNVYDKALMLQPKSVKPPLDFSKCPDCKGRGMVYVESLKADKKCFHPSMSEVVNA